MVTSEDGLAYLKSCTPLGNGAAPLLPVHNNPVIDTAVRPSTTSHAGNHQSPTSHPSGQPVSQIHSQPSGSIAVPTHQLSNSAGLVMDLFLCVDQRWSDPPKATLRSIQKVNSFADDEEFYKSVKKNLRDVEGGLLDKATSWKSCRDFEFIQVRSTCIPSASPKHQIDCTSLIFLLLVLCCP